MSDDRTKPSFSTRLWSEEVGMADPSANFNAPPTLDYAFGGRTLRTDINTTLYSQPTPIAPIQEVAVATRQAQRSDVLAAASSENISTDTSITASQAQASHALAPVNGTAPQAVASAASRQGQRSVGYASTGAANDPPQTGTPIAMGAQITTFKLENTSAGALANQPFSLGHVFALGHLPSAGAGIDLQLPDGTSIASQLNVKALHADGSVRHAIVCGVLPTLAASASQTVSMKRAAAAAAAPNVGLPATLPSASVVISGTTYTATAAGAAYDTWFAGPVCSDYIFNVPFVGPAGPHPTLTAQFSVRVSRTGQARVDYVIEHCKAYASTADIVYDVTLSAGTTTYYSKTGLVHTPAARWKRTYWIGTAPSLHIKHDTAYLIASRQIPNYDQSVTIPESVLAGFATDLTSGKFDPMKFGRLQPAMGTTGGRPDIGIMPDTHVATVLSMDKRAKAIALATGDIGGSWPMCRRDDSSGPGRGYPLSVINFPYASLLGNPGDCVNPATGKNEKLPILSTVTTAGPDSSHQPDIYYLPYLLTGDLFYLEGLHFWATFNHYQDNPYYRDFAKAHVRADQLRGQGWSLRTMAECVAITPEDHPLKPHFATWYDNNMKWYLDAYIDAPNPAYVNQLGIIVNGYSLSYPINGGTSNGIAPWMDDFFTQSLGHGYELLGLASTKRLLFWKAKFQVGRMNDPAVCVQNSCTYALGVRATATSPFFATLGECFAFTVSPQQQQYPCGSAQRLALASSMNLLPGDIDGYPSSTDGYPADYQPALAAAVDVGYPGGGAAWAKYMARPTKPDYGYQAQFAILPRQAIVAQAGIDATVHTAQPQHSASFGSAGGAAPQPPETGTAIAVGAQITDFTVENTATSSAANVPFTLGHPFAVGHLPASGAGITLKLADNSSIAAQLDVKALHPDGSVRHAIISGVVPAMTAGEAKPVKMLRRDASADAAPTATLAAQVAAGLEATVAIVAGGVTYTARLSQLASTGSVKPWLAGSVANEWLVSGPLTDAGNNQHPLIHARFYVRAYAGLNRARVDVTLENSWVIPNTSATTGGSAWIANNPADVTYDVTVTVPGDATYSKSALVHYNKARWTRTFWWNGASPAHVRHNIPYVLASRAVPNYDRNAGQSTSVIANYVTLLAGRNEPMQPGVMTAAQGGTGGRPDIGLNPGWCVNWLLTGNRDAKNVSVRTSMLAGSWPTHFRNKATDNWVDIRSYPYVCLQKGSSSDDINGATGLHEMIPAAANNNANVPNDAHEPNHSYIPYLLTGDYIHLEELQAWNEWNMIQHLPGYRHFANGAVFHQQARGLAWLLRTLAHTAYISPEGDPIKQRCLASLDWNLDQLNAMHTYSADPVSGNALGFVHNNETSAIIYPGSLSGVGSVGVSTWQDDFITSSVGMVAELGFTKARPFLAWKAKFAVGRMLSGSDYCWIMGTPYSLDVRATANGPIFTTWAQVYEATVDPRIRATACASQAMADACTTVFGDYGTYVPGQMPKYSASDDGYPADAQPAFAYVATSDHPQGANVWLVFDGRALKAPYNDPQFAIVPRTA
jgi:hypothetical protein